MFLETLASQYAYDLEGFSMETTFSDLHMDSYDQVDYLMKVEEHYGITFSDDKMLSIGNMQTVRRIVNNAVKNQEGI
jgi:acyl carrier protein